MTATPVSHPSKAMMGGWRRRRMVSSIGKRSGFVLGLVLCAGIPSLSAQIFLGRIDVVVQDASGRALSGAKVTTSAPFDSVQTTDALGEAHFLSLPVDSYSVTAALAGFTSATRE